MIMLLLGALVKLIAFCSAIAVIIMIHVKFPKVTHWLVAGVLIGLLFADNLPELPRVIAMVWIIGAHCTLSSFLSFSREDSARHARKEALKAGELAKESEVVFNRMAGHPTNLKS